MERLIAILKTGSHVIKMTVSRRGWKGARLPLSIFNVEEALVTYGDSHLMITKCVKQGET